MAMKKLALSVDDLRVDSFETTAPEDRKGTVYGQSPGFGTYYGDTCESTCWQIACTCTAGGPQQGTCDYSCGGTCGGEETCIFTCNLPDCPSQYDC